MKTKLDAIRKSATDALRLAIPMSRKTGWEFGGLIYGEQAPYLFTAPHTSQENGSLDILPALSKLAGRTLPDPIKVPVALALFRKLRVVSVYHTHPCMDRRGERITNDPKWARFGSSNDMGQLVQGQFDSTYIGVVCSGEVIELTPDLPVLFPFEADGDLTPGALGPVISYI